MGERVPSRGSATACATLAATNTTETAATARRRPTCCRRAANDGLCVYEADGTGKLKGGFSVAPLARERRLEGRRLEETEVVSEEVRTRASSRNRTGAHVPRVGGGRLRRGDGPRCVGDDCARTAVVLAVDGYIVEPVIGTIVCTVLSDAVSGEEVGKECHGLFDTPVSPDDDEVPRRPRRARDRAMPTAKLPRAACGSHLELRATVYRIAMSDVRSRACSAAVAVHAVWDAAAGCPSAEADARASRRLQVDGAAQGGYDAAQGGSDASQGGSDASQSIDPLRGCADPPAGASRTRASPSAPNVRRVRMTATAATAAAVTASAAPTAAATAGPAGQPATRAAPALAPTRAAATTWNRRRRRRGRCHGHGRQRRLRCCVRRQFTCFWDHGGSGASDSPDAVTCLRGGAR